MTHGTTDHRHRPRHAQAARRRSAARGAALALVGLVAFVLSGSAFAYSSLQGNIIRHDVTALLGDDRPTQESGSADPIDPNAGEPINILVMGSDTRAGENSGYGDDIEGMRSDTTLLVHIAADRSRADIVSIPRDLLVDIPSCTLPDGSQSYVQNQQMFNVAFATGGQDGEVEYAAACTIKTVEEMSDVYVDDFVVADFTGFIRMVDALGGVPMCIEEDMFSPQADLDLEAGYQTLDGHDALAYARARKNVGDGSDISRIGRQQLLLGAMVRQLLSKNLLTDLPALYQFLDAATESLTAGRTIGQIPNMVGVANSLRAVPAEGVSFVTVPFDPAGARVVPNADTEALWEAIAADEPIAPAAEEPTQDAGDPAADGTGDGAADPSDAETTQTDPSSESELPWDVVTGADEAGVCG